MPKNRTLLSWIPDGKRTFRWVLFWWEIRRPLYNIVVLPFAITGSILTLFVLEKVSDHNIDPEFNPFLFIVAGCIFSNIFYGFGWVIDGLLPEKYGNLRGKRSLYLWIAGTVFSILLCFEPAVLTIIFGPP